ncbi:hypothetical protein [Arthrobacter pigmenti]
MEKENRKKILQRRSAARMLPGAVQRVDPLGNTADLPPATGRSPGGRRIHIDSLLGLSAPSGFVLSAGLPLETLVVVGAGSLLAAAVLGEALTVKLRLPVPGKARRGWLDELRTGPQSLRR